jgi:hypothetical protein
MSVVTCLFKTCVCMVTLSMCLIRNYGTNTYEELEVQLHAFLISTLL